MRLRVQCDRVACRHAAKAEENLLAGKALHLFGECGHDIRGKHDVISMLMSRPGGGFHAQIGRDSAQHDGRDTASPQLKIEIRDRARGHAIAGIAAALRVCAPGLDEVLARDIAAVVLNTMKVLRRMLAKDAPTTSGAPDELRQMHHLKGPVAAVSACSRQHNGRRAIISGEGPKPSTVSSPMNTSAKYGLQSQKDSLSIQPIKPRDQTGVGLVCFMVGIGGHRF